MDKGFFAAKAKTSKPAKTATPPTRKKAPDAKAKQPLNGVFSVHGDSAPAASKQKQKYSNDYSRFDSFGKSDWKKEDRDRRAKLIPEGLRAQLGESGIDMALAMAEKEQASNRAKPKTPEESLERFKEMASRAKEQQQEGSAASAPQRAGGKPMTGKARRAEARMRKGLTDLDQKTNILKQQQEQLERLTSTTGSGDTEIDAAGLMSFLAEQGLSEADMEAVLRGGGNDKTSREVLSAAVERQMDAQMGKGSATVKADKARIRELDTEQSAMRDELARLQESIEETKRTHAAMEQSQKAAREQVLATQAELTRVEVAKEKASDNVDAAAQIHVRKAAEVNPAAEAMLDEPVPEELAAAADFTSKCDEAARQIVLKVALPDVTSMAQVELDVSDCVVRVAAPVAGYGALDVALREHGLPAGTSVDRSAVRAKWIKKQCCLRVTLRW